MARFDWNFDWNFGYWRLAIASGLVSGLVGGAPALAQPFPGAQPSPAAGSAPSAKLDQLLYFQGTWQCQARPATAKVSTPFARYTWSVKRTLNNYWFLGNVTAADRSALAHDTLGFNTLSNKFGRTILTADGGFYNFLSDGWKENTFTWEGSALDMASQSKRSMREVLVKKTNQRFEAIFYTQDPESKRWTADVREVCEKRSPSPSSMKG
jgi:hypothetical protein